MPIDRQISTRPGNVPGVGGGNAGGIAGDLATLLGATAQTALSTLDQRAQKRREQLDEEARVEQIGFQEELESAIVSHTDADTGAFDDAGFTGWVQERSGRAKTPINAAQFRAAGLSTRQRILAEISERSIRIEELEGQYDAKRFRPQIGQAMESAIAQAGRASAVNPLEIGTAFLEEIEQREAAEGVQRSGAFRQSRYEAMMEVALQGHASAGAAHLAQMTDRTMALGTSVIAEYAAGNPTVTGLAGLIRESNARLGSLGVKSSDIQEWTSAQFENIVSLAKATGNAGLLETVEKTAGQLSSDVTPDTLTLQRQIAEARRSIATDQAKAHQDAIRLSIEQASQPQHVVKALGGMDRSILTDGQQAALESRARERSEQLVGSWRSEAESHVRGLTTNATSEEDAHTALRRLDDYRQERMIDAAGNEVARVDDATYEVLRGGLEKKFAGIVETKAGRKRVESSIRMGTVAGLNLSDEDSKGDGGLVNAWVAEQTATRLDPITGEEIPGRSLPEVVADLWAMGGITPTLKKQLEQRVNTVVGPNGENRELVAEALRAGLAMQEFNPALFRETFFGSRLPDDAVSGSSPRLTLGASLVDAGKSTDEVIDVLSRTNIEQIDLASGQVEELRPTFIDHRRKATNPPGVMLYMNHSFQVPNPQAAREYEATFTYHMLEQIRRIDPGDTEQVDAAGKRARAAADQDHAANWTVLRVFGRRYEFPTRVLADAGEDERRRMASVIEDQMRLAIDLNDIDAEGFRGLFMGGHQVVRPEFGQMTEVEVNGETRLAIPLIEQQDAFSESIVPDESGLFGGDSPFMVIIPRTQEEHAAIAANLRRRREIMDRAIEIREEQVLRSSGQPAWTANEEGVAAEIPPEPESLSEIYMRLLLTPPETEIADAG